MGASRLVITVGVGTGETRGRESYPGPHRTVVPGLVSAVIAASGAVADLRPARIVDIVGVSQATSTTRPRGRV